VLWYFFQFNPVPLNFNPNNKAMIEKISFKGEYNALEKKLDDLSEGKKSILLYIDQLNQDYDNPIRKRISHIQIKKKNLRSSKGIILKADSNSETNDKDYVFFFLS
jgi:hypothetical protein